MPRHLGLHGTIATAMPACGQLGAAAAAAFLAVCALALALCASHSGQASGRLRRALASVSRRRTDPVISSHQMQPGGEAPPRCVWQKNILMGEKCQLPDFSGAIIYDSAGNVVAPGARKNILMGEKCQLPDFSGAIIYDSAGNVVAPGRPRAVPALGW